LAAYESLAVVVGPRGRRLCQREWIRSGECLLQALIERPFEALPSIFLLVDLLL
jgi:hypothetical protein